MKIGQIALVAITLTTGFALNAQETNGKRNSQETKLTTNTSLEVNSLSLTPEQTAINKTEALKAKVQLTDDQITSVKSLFLKIENRKASLASLSSEEKAKAMQDLQSVEDRELNSILSPSQQKLNSGSNSTVKPAANM